MTLASKSKKKWKIANLYEGVVERKHKLEIDHIEAKKNKIKRVSRTKAFAKTENKPVLWQGTN